jgi:hypothetical protein
MLFNVLIYTDVLLTIYGFAKDQYKVAHDYKSCKS